MKNTQKGFIIPLAIAIVAILAIGVGIYAHDKSKEVAQTSALGIATTTNISNTQSSDSAISTSAKDAQNPFIWEGNYGFKEFAPPNQT